MAWWDAYQNIKHDRGRSFQKATYFNAVYALSALYILVFYLSKITGFQFAENEAKYLDSDYACQLLAAGSPKKLPGYEIL